MGSQITLMALILDLFGNKNKSTRMGARVQQVVGGRWRGGMLMRGRKWGTVTGAGLVMELFMGVL
jgi:hypothetical protein